MVINGRLAYKCSRVACGDVASLSEFSFQTSSENSRLPVAMLLLSPSFFVRSPDKNAMMKIAKRKDVVLVVEATSCTDV